MAQSKPGASMEKSMEMMATVNKCWRAYLKCICVAEDKMNCDVDSPLFPSPSIHWPFLGVVSLEAIVQLNDFL
jgi:hypothetical protein